MQMIIEYMIAYGFIGIIWEALEKALYGYSQSSSIDAAVAGYLAYRLIVWFWLHFHNDKGDSV